MKHLVFSLAAMAALTLVAPAGAQSKKFSFKKFGINKASGSNSNVKKISNVTKFIGGVKKNFHGSHFAPVKKNCHTGYCPPVHKKIHHHGHCAPSHIHTYSCHHRNWGHYCWLPNYNCYGYFCPVRHCWYYFYQPWNCYLPISYANQYQPVAVPVNAAPPVNGGTPPLPPGATPVPVGQVPPLPVGQ